jgi:hypothetical protein
MSFTASFDTIEFFRDGKQHIRVYYQFNHEKIIRESSYDQENGWFVRGDGIVVTDAKSKSPITVTRWTDNKDTTEVFNT